MRIITARKILQANEQAAAENRRRFAKRGVFAVNLLGSPGCGKTTLLEALLRRLGRRARPAVIEGDLAGQIDAERIEKLEVPVVQINTDGMCHLDAPTIAAAVEDLGTRNVDLLWIENVGNLVCTAGYDLGEHLRMVVLSVPEGDDKLVKYPGIFRRSHALVVTKTDLLPHTDFQIDRVRADFGRLAPEAAFFAVSARHGDGIDPLADWLVAQMHCTR